jgi:ABC-type transporter Mla subunit MlaD
VSLLAQDERLTRRVGAITLVVTGLAIAFFVFVYDQIEWGSHTRIKVYFHTTGGLREGAAFVVAGKAVGRVEAIALVPKGEKQILGDEDGVEVTVAIHTGDARRIMFGGDVFVASRGPLAGKYLEIGPAPLPKPGEPPLRSLREGDEVRGRDPPSLDRVLQRTWNNMATARAFADEVRPEMNALSAELDALRATLAEIAPEATFAADVEALVAEARLSYDALGGEAGIEKLDAVLDRTGDVVTQARATIAKLRKTSAQLSENLAVMRDRVATRGAEALARIEVAIDRVRLAIDKVDPLLAHVEALRLAFVRGDGSLLKLMRDPEFPEDAKELGKVLKRQPWKIISRPPK